jgi:hypothetical protein
MYLALWVPKPDSPLTIVIRKRKLSDFVFTNVSDLEEPTTKYRPVDLNGMMIFRLPGVIFSACSVFVL